MKLSLFTTLTEPYRRGDNAGDALICYKELADEVVVINGGFNSLRAEGVKEIKYLWKHDFDWAFIGQQFQRGYEACTGDWVLHSDIDFIFHENDFEAIRQACRDNPNAPAISMWKYQFILPDRYNIKSRLVTLVNKGKYGDRIKFDGGGESDLCQPSLDGKLITSSDVPEARVPFYNYERLIKTKEQIKADAERMENAYFAHYGVPLYSHDGNSAYQGLINMMCGRFNKPQKEITLSEHPKYVQTTISKLEEKHWGYSGFGLLGANNYVKN